MASILLAGIDLHILANLAKNYGEVRALKRVLKTPGSKGGEDLEYLNNTSYCISGTARLHGGNRYWRTLPAPRWSEQLTFCFHCALHASAVLTCPPDRKQEQIPADREHMRTPFQNSQASCTTSSVVAADHTRLWRLKIDYLMYPAFH